MEATADGKIRVHAKSIKSLGLPVKGLMKVLGIEMDDMLKMEAGHGVTVDDNDFIIDPTEVLPPPKLRGKATAVRIEGDEILHTFGTGAAACIRPRAVSKNTTTTSRRAARAVDRGARRWPPPTSGWFCARDRE